MNGDQLAELELAAQAPCSCARCAQLARHVLALSAALREEWHQQSAVIERRASEHAVCQTEQAALAGLQNRLLELDTALPDPDELERAAELLDAYERGMRPPQDLGVARDYLAYAADHLRSLLAAGVE